MDRRTRLSIPNLILFKFDRMTPSTAMSARAKRLTISCKMTPMSQSVLLSLMARTLASNNSTFLMKNKTLTIRIQWWWAEQWTHNTLSNRVSTANNKIKCLELEVSQWATTSSSTATWPPLVEASPTTKHNLIKAVLTALPLTLANLASLMPPLSPEMTVPLQMIDSLEGAVVDSRGLFCNNSNQPFWIKDSNSNNMVEWFPVKINSLLLILHLIKAEEVNSLSKISLSKTYRIAKPDIACREILLERNPKLEVVCKTHHQWLDPGQRLSIFLEIKKAHKKLYLTEVVTCLINLFRVVVTKEVQALTELNMCNKWTQLTLTMMKVVRVIKELLILIRVLMGETK